MVPSSSSSSRGAILAPLVLCATVIAGCTLGNLNSIHRQFDTDRGKSQLVDVKQRSILVHERHISATGVPAGTPTRPIVCAEPSPDALAVYSSALAANVTHTSGTGGAFQFASGEAGSAFGLRTQSIQLLRDAYYRACEAYIGEAIDEETYDVLIRRLNTQAIAYLAIEQITSGAAVAAQASAVAPDFKALVAALDKAQKDLETANAEKKALEEKRTKLTDEEEKKKLDPDIKAAGDRTAAAQGAVAKARDEITNAAKAAVATAASPAKGGSVGEAAVAAAENIALAIVNADYSTQMCYAHRRRQQVAGDRVDEYCRETLDNHRKAQDAAVSRAVNLATAIQAQCGHPLKTDSERQLCAQLVGASVSTAHPIGSPKSAATPATNTPGPSLPGANLVPM